MTQPAFPSIRSKGPLVDRVVQAIQQRIVQRELAPGMMLPTENELAEQFGVSRTVVREAVRVLRAKGLVEARQGVGTVVRQLTRAQLVEPLALLAGVHSGGVTLDQLYQVRTLLEIEVAGLAAEHATEADVETLRALIEEMELHRQDPEAFAGCEADFHQALGAATQNPLLELLLGVIRDLLEEYVRRVLEQQPDARKRYVARHRQIVQWVAAGDATRARAEMAEHLRKVKETMKELAAG